MEGRTGGRDRISNGMEWDNYAVGHACLEDFEGTNPASRSQSFSESALGPADHHRAKQIWWLRPVV